MPAHPVQEDLLSSLQSPSVASDFLEALPQRCEIASPAQNAGALPNHLPTELLDTVWRAAELGRAQSSSVSTGFPDLDAEIPEGGWPCGGLIEILQPQPSVQE